MAQNYIVRNNQIEEVWKVEYMNNYFKQVLFIRGTEDEFRSYMESEFGYVGRYSGCTDDEIAAVNKLRIPIYIAPELS